MEMERYKHLARTAVALLVVLCFGLTAGAGEAEPGEGTPDEERVHPAAYRIRVEYDERTNEQIRSELRRAARRAMTERRRRFELSRRELERSIGREMEQFKREIEAARKARQETDTARAEPVDEVPGPEQEPDAEPDLPQVVHDPPAERAPELDGEPDAPQTVREPSTERAEADEDPRAALRRERRVAAEALRRLDELLGEIEKNEAAEAAERGEPGILPPHR